MTCLVLRATAIIAVLSSFAVQGCEGVGESPSVNARSDKELVKERRAGDFILEIVKGRTGREIVLEFARLRAARSTDEDICLDAVGKVDGNLEFTMEPYAEAARSRGLTVERCTELTGVRYYSQEEAVKELHDDEAICRMAGQDDAQKEYSWTKIPASQVYVTEARSRGLTVQRCAQLTGRQ